VRVIQTLPNSHKKSKLGSETSSAEGNNNSDNSALVSIGNTSFGFNFDSEEGANSGNSDKNEQSDDSEGAAGVGNEKTAKNVEAKARAQLKHDKATVALRGDDHPSTVTMPKRGRENSSVSMTYSVTTSNADLVSVTHDSISASPQERLLSKQSAEGRPENQLLQHAPMSSLSSSVGALKRAQSGEPEDNTGYNSDDESVYSESKQRAAPATAATQLALENASSAGSAAAAETNSAAAETRQSSTASRAGAGSTTSGSKRRKKNLDDNKREERNAREKERSFRIAKQISDLRDALSAGGIVIPKGTKSSVLVEAANYIRMLQEHQYRSEM
jgi:Helix-loop-helix DNA-binding domain